jgi:glutamate synthase domain-containing protein 3
LRALLSRHRELTGSERAQEVLADWPRAVEDFWLVTPRPEVGRLEAAAEGTEHDDATEAVTP